MCSSQKYVRKQKSLEKNLTRIPETEITLLMLKISGKKITICFTNALAYIMVKLQKKYANSIRVELRTKLTNGNNH